MTRVLPSKADLRAQFRTYRARLTPAERDQKSRAIAARLQALPELQAARTVHLYWPMDARGEVDVRPLASWLQTQKKQLVLPVVRTFVSDGTEGPPRMEARAFDGIHALQPNRWGVLEPVGTPAVPPEAIDVVVVPALGAGRNGHRIGYGRGYYDAFLAALEAVLVCPVYAACLVEAVPGEPHDVPVHALVTEAETVRPAAP